MKVKQLGLEGLIKQAASKDGLCLDIGSFCVRLKSRETTFLKVFEFLYQDFPLLPADTFADFHIVIERPKGMRHFLKPQVIFITDGQQPFEPFPLSHAFPLFEWGLNWCIARRSHQYLMLHAAVVEKQGKALILPALPGSGKSTLSAALAMYGWRFLSDEFTMIRPQDGKILPIPRPTPLKNASIQVIKENFLNAEVGPLFPKTRKGTVAHLRTPESSVEQLKQAVLPELLIFPKYQANSEIQLNQLNKPYVIFKLASNAFNYELMGKAGFELVKNVTASCRCYNLTYSDLDQALPLLDDLLMQNV